MTNPCLSLPELHDKRRLVSSSMLASCDRLWVVPPLTIYTDFTWTVAQPPLGGSSLVAGHHNTRSYYTEIIQKEIAASNYGVKYIFFIFSYNNECTNFINIEHWISYIMSHVTWSVQLARPDHHQLQEDEHWGHHLRITLAQFQNLKSINWILCPTSL